MNLSIRKCSEDDVEALQQISVTTFSETFEQQNTASSMNEYLNQNFPLEFGKHSFLMGSAEQKDLMLRRYID